MIKWAEIAGVNSNLRLDTLSQFLNDDGAANELHYLPATDENFEEIFSAAQDQYDSILVGSPFRSTIIRLFERQSYMSRVINSVDCLIKEHGDWLLRSYHHVGFQKEISKVGSGLDIEGSVLLVGAGSLARVVISVLIKVGFKTFNITNKFNDEGLKLIEELKRNYFGAEFNFIPHDRLVTLPGTNSIMVNTTPFIESNDLLNELYYFNFLKPTGLVIDFSLSPAKTPLIAGAEGLGLRVAHGYEVSAICDMVWAEWVFSRKFDVDKYTEVLRQAVEKSSPQVSQPSPQ